MSSMSIFLMGLVLISSWTTVYLTQLQIVIVYLKSNKKKEINK